MLTRATADSALKHWAQSLRARIGFKRAVVAVARKLAVVLHAMWKSGKPFDAGTTSMAGEQTRFPQTSSATNSGGVQPGR